MIYGYTKAGVAITDERLAELLWDIPDKGEEESPRRRRRKSRLPGEDEQVPDMRRATARRKARVPTRPPSERRRIYLRRKGIAADQ